MHTHSQNPGTSLDHHTEIRSNLSFYIQSLQTKGVLIGPGHFKLITKMPTLAQITTPCSHFHNLGTPAHHHTLQRIGLVYFTNAPSAQSNTLSDHNTYLSLCIQSLLKEFLLLNLYTLQKFLLQHPKHLLCAHFKNAGKPAHDRRSLTVSLKPIADSEVVNSNLV